MGDQASAIVVENLRKTYGATKAVDGVSFDVRPGEVFGMLGPNGAGKSTTIEIIEGLRTADSGLVTVLGLRQPNEARAIKSRIGIQLQTTSLYPRLSVTEILDLFHTFYHDRQTLPTATLIQLVDLTEKKDTRSKQLSGGQKQRLSVALALVNDPDIVFLDEPTTGMDPQARRRLWDVVLDLKRKGKTILMTTHYMEEAEQICDRVAIVDHGHIIEIGSPADLVQRHFSEIAISFQAPDMPTDYTALAGVSRAVGEDDRVTVY
ncbi:MAG TPA: ABC transporter ATP-binding protein, partial [Ktedonobacterales bacterium]|nr:ABC transporter ATP-binding protein [Ktedonobacterales bacterium]